MFSNMTLLLKIQWIFVILLSLFVIRNFRCTCSSIEVLKRYMAGCGARSWALCLEPEHK